MPTEGRSSGTKQGCLLTFCTCHQYIFFFFQTTFTTNPYPTMSTTPILPAYVLPNPTTLFRLVQCRRCFLHGHHQHQCPNIHSPQLCSHCSLPGHPYTSCTNPPQCAHCGGAHPVTSLICPIYQSNHYTHLLITC